MRIAKVVTFQRNQGRRGPSVSIFRFEYPNLTVIGNMSSALAKCAIKRTLPSYEISKCIMWSLVPDLFDLKNLHLHRGRPETTRGQNQTQYYYKMSLVCHIHLFSILNLVI